jgi:hypothetical protein
MRNYQKTFLKAAFNSLLPEFMDSDRMRLSPELKAFLRKVGDHYYKDDATTAARLAEFERKGQIGNVRSLRAGAVTYEMINEMTGSGNFFQEAGFDGDAHNIKMILGNFQMRREGDGYRIKDIYDFSDNQKFIREYLPEITETLEEAGFEQKTINAMTGSSLGQLALGAGSSMRRGTAFPLARMLGGLLMSDRYDPENGSSQTIDEFIGPEDEVNNNYPSPRVAWFEDDNIEPVFPATAMDEERKNLLEKALDAMFPPAEAMLAVEGTAEIVERSVDDSSLFGAYRRQIDRLKGEPSAPMPQSKPTKRQRLINSIEPDEDTVAVEARRLG